MCKAMFETMSRPGVFPVLPLGESASNLAGALFRLLCGAIPLIKYILKY